MKFVTHQLISVAHQLIWVSYKFLGLQICTTRNAEKSVTVLDLVRCQRACSDRIREVPLSTHIKGFVKVRR